VTLSTQYVEHFKVFHVSLLTFVGSSLSSDTFDYVEHFKVFHVFHVLLLTFCWQKSQVALSTSIRNTSMCGVFKVWRTYHF